MLEAIIDFNKISRALNYSLEVISQGHQPSESALRQLQQANEEFQHALTFCLSCQQK